MLSNSKTEIDTWLKLTYNQIFLQVTSSVRFLFVKIQHFEFSNCHHAWHRILKFALVEKMSRCDSPQFTRFKYIRRCVYAPLYSMLPSIRQLQFITAIIFLP